MDGSGIRLAKLLDDGEKYFKSVQRYLSEHDKSIKFTNPSHVERVKMLPSIKKQVENVEVSNKKQVENEKVSNEKQVENEEVSNEKHVENEETLIKKNSGEKYVHIFPIAFGQMQLLSTKLHHFNADKIQIAIFSFNFDKVICFNNTYVSKGFPH